MYTHQNMRVLCCLPFIIVSVFVSPVKSQKATLYEHTGRGGRSFKVNAERGNCVALPTKWRERTSSIDTHGTCIIGFENSDCTGKYLRIRPEIGSYIPNMKRAHFNDLISSVKACQGQASLKSGRYAIQNAEDKMYLTARHIVQGYTMVETEEWKKKLSQQWDLEKGSLLKLNQRNVLPDITNYSVRFIRTRDGTYWLIPRVHVSKNRLTYEMRKLKKEDFPEIGMFKERVYWRLENIRKNKFMIKNDDTGNCLTRPDDSEIEEDECDSDSKNQQWLFYTVQT